MFQRLRSRLHGEEGFTLIELLVVILIIGILAAIAIPSFLNQKGKANDADAKSLVRTAQTAMETYGTDHNGDFSAATNTDLHTIEPSITAADVTVTTGVANQNYKLTVTSPGGDGRTFSITANTDGTVDRTCHVPAGKNAGGCESPDATTGIGSW